jgi:hypothetical protein
MKVSTKAQRLSNTVVILEDSVEVSISCQVSKTLVLTMYWEEAFKTIVGAEGARPVWGFTEATFRFYVYHLSQLHLNMYNISYYFSCTIWWQGKPSLEDLCFLREESRVPDLQGLPMMAMCTFCSHGAMSFATQSPKMAYTSVLGKPEAACLPIYGGVNAQAWTSNQIDKPSRPRPSSVCGNVDNTLCG